MAKKKKRKVTVKRKKNQPKMTIVDGTGKIVKHWWNWKNNKTKDRL